MKNFRKRSLRSIKNKIKHYIITNQEVYPRRRLSHPLDWLSKTKWSVLETYMWPILKGHDRCICILIHLYVYIATLVEKGEDMGAMEERIGRGKII